MTVWAVVGLAGLAVFGIGGGLWFRRVYGQAKEKVLARRAVGVIAPRLSRDYLVAIEALAVGDREPMAAALLEDQPTTERLDSLRRVAAIVPGDQAQAWVAEAPEHPAALLLGAAVLLHVASEHRGGGTADTVSEDDAQAYMACSAIADQLATRLAELRPDDAVPWALRMQAAFALTGALEDHTWLYEQAIARDPDSWALHRAALLAASEKWFGSHGRMFEIARAAARDRPESPLALMIVPAHLERWFHLSYFDEDEAAADAYWERPDVRGEVARAFDAFIPHAPPNMDGHLARCEAAGWFYTRHDLARLKAAFGELPVYFERPWQNHGGERAYREARMLVEADEALHPGPTAQGAG